MLFVCPELPYVPPFYFIVVGPSAPLDPFIRHRTFSMKEDKVYALSPRADSVLLANSSLRKTEFFFNT